MARRGPLAGHRYGAGANVSGCSPPSARPLTLHLRDPPNHSLTKLPSRLRTRTRIARRTTVTVKVAHVRLCHSRMMFARAYPREAQEMVFDAHDRAFAFFRGACTLSWVGLDVELSNCLKSVHRYADAPPNRIERVSIGEIANRPLSRQKSLPNSVQLLYQAR